MRTKRPFRPVAALLAGFCLLSAPACHHKRADETYADSAKSAFDEAMEVFDDEDYPEAIKRLTTVKNKYAYSKFAALAELRIADAYYEQDKWIEAIDAYRTFAQSRPNHGDVPYALWRMGRAYYEQIPSDFFILPPVHERDPAASKDALRALEQYVERFPADDHAADARERIVRCRETLADSELYVAHFYLRDDRPVSARGRLERVVAEYADLPDRWSEGALLLAKVYETLGLTAEARQTATRLAETQPSRPEADAARELLSRLPLSPTPPAASAPPSADPFAVPPPPSAAPSAG